MSDIPSRHHSDEIPGKRTCRLLREMRKQLAEANRIPYTPAECTSTAPCTGSCPVCEEELAYLNRERAKKPTKWQIYPT